MLKNRKNLVSISSLCSKKTAKQMQKSRTSHPKILCKKGVLKFFAKFPRKNLCWSLFLTELPDPKCFHANFAIFSRTHIF